MVSCRLILEIFSGMSLSHHCEAKKGTVACHGIDSAGILDRCSKTVLSAELQLNSTSLCN